MAEVGAAFVSIVPSTRGFGSKLESGVAPEVSKSGRSVGSRFGGALKVGAVGVATAAGAGIGAALFKGFNRLKSIDQARAKLTGLGHDTKTVDLIMQNALKSVKGTAFGLGDAATVSASAVAAGIKPGRELTATLKLVADAATIGGSSLGEMGAIFNKVAASNKVQGDVINQLNDQGIPIVQLLGKQLGVTSSEVTKLAAKGKIDFKTFSAAMQAGLGGAALKSGATFSGALANVGASLGRIGAGLIGGVFPYLAPAFAGITAALTPLEGKASSVGEAIGRVLGPALAGLGPFLTKIVTGLTTMDFSKVSAGEGPISKIGASLKTLGATITSIDFGQIGTALGKGAADTISVFSVAIGFAADHMGTFAKILPALVVAFAAYKAAQAAANVLAIANIPITAAQVVAQFALASSNRALATQMAITNGVESTGILTRARGTIATIASTIASKAAAVGAKIWAASQWLLNAALTANPIGLVVVAIVALVAGLIYAYKHSETFRNIVNKAFAAVKSVVSSVVSWFGKYVPRVFAVVVSLVRGYVGVYVAVIRTAFNVAKAVVMTAVRIVSTTVRSLAGAFTAAVGFVQRFHAGVVRFVGQVITFIRALPGKVRSGLSGFASILTGIGGQIIQGLANGIRNAAGRVLDAVRAVVNLIPKKVRQIMGIASPSKVMRGFGANIGEGLALGIGDTERLVANASDRMARRVSAPHLALSSSLGSDGSAPGSRSVTQNIYETTDARATARESARQLAFAG